MFFRTVGKAFVEGEESPNYFAVRQKNSLATYSSPNSKGIPCLAGRQAHATSLSQKHRFEMNCTTNTWSQTKSKI